MVILRHLYETKVKTMASKVLLTLQTIYFALLDKYEQIINFTFIDQLQCSQPCIPNHTLIFFSDAFWHLLMPSSCSHCIVILFLAHLENDCVSDAEIIDN